MNGHRRVKAQTPCRRGDDGESSNGLSSFIDVHPCHEDRSPVECSLPTSGADCSTDPIEYVCSVTVKDLFYGLPDQWSGCDHRTSNRPISPWSQSAM